MTNMTPCPLEPHSCIVQPRRATAGQRHRAAPASSWISPKCGTEEGHCGRHLAAAPSPCACGPLLKLPPLQHFPSPRCYQLTATCRNLSEEPAHPHVKAKSFPKWLSKEEVFARYSISRKGKETKYRRQKALYQTSFSVPFSSCSFSLSPSPSSKWKSN